MYDKNFKKLMFSIIYQSLRDLTSNNKKIKKEAEDFLKSDTCKIYCSAIGINGSVFKSINYENPTSTMNLNVKYNKEKKCKKHKKINNIDKYLNEIFEK